MKILEYLKNNYLFLDGGMGTILQNNGLVPGELPERWNITKSDVIVDIHKSYYEAGSNVVLTNTFGANSLKLSDEELEKIVFSAIDNAFKARDISGGEQEKFVALDIGPLGKLIKPLGDMDFEDAVNIFAKTISLGAKKNVDLIFIETMNDSLETKAALLAAKENSSLPVFVSNAFGEDNKLMTGATPEAMIAMLEGMGADAIGINCSLGPREVGPIIEKYIKYSSLPIILKPNAGLPKVCEGATVYDVSATEFAGEMQKYAKGNVRIFGGCCGTDFDYIRETVKGIKDIKNPVPAIEEKHFSSVSSYTHAVFFGEKPILIGERINPTGKKKLKEALINLDYDYILKQGISEEEKGAHILDVNVGLPEIDECAVLKKAVFELQSILDLPLQIDTSDAKAMEGAARIYNGKPMINSVNGTKESMDKVFPIVKKYGGLVVALTLDEEGIPGSVEGRLIIARKILSEAKKYGISKKNIIFDPLAMTVSTDKNAALVTLETVKRIHDELGCLTSLGISNVSFGLPNRPLINASFFMMALSNGLSAAIMNPDSKEMMETYFAYNALSGKDENFLEYMAFSEGQEVNKAIPQEVKALSLREAIKKGLKEEAKNLTIELLKTIDPFKIISDEIIPALDEVGKGFEEKTIFLPGLLMSAEASEKAFEEIKKVSQSNAKSTDKNAIFVLATVKGDIHDIGKNIVKLLLENFCFDVHDLGKDVAPEKVVEEVKKTNAPLVGLSALMTTTLPAMEETIKLLKKETPFAKVIVGGAVLTKEYATKIGADFYAKDAFETVRLGQMIIKK